MSTKIIILMIDCVNSLLVLEILKLCLTLQILMEKYYYARNWKTQQILPSIQASFLILWWYKSWITNTNITRITVNATSIWTNFLTIIEIRTFINIKANMIFIDRFSFRANTFERTDFILTFSTLTSQCIAISFCIFLMFVFIYSHGTSLTYGY